MKRSAYTYKLLNSYRQKNASIEWIRIWLKQAANGHKYKFNPIIITYTSKAGFYLEKRFKTFVSLKKYMEANAV